MRNGSVTLLLSAPFFCAHPQRHHPPSDKQRYHCGHFLVEGLQCFAHPLTPQFLHPPLFFWLRCICLSPFTSFSLSLSLWLPCSFSLAAAAVIVFYDALTYATIYFHFHYHSLSPFTYPLPAFSAAHFVMIKDGQNGGYLPRSCSLVRGI